MTSNDAGLAVPDWPTTFGENMFLYPVSKWVGNVFFEHAHRLWGAAVGMMTIAVVMWSSLKERRRWVRRFAWSMLAMVIVQGVLGGLRVTELSIALAIVHGCLAQLFFCATLTLVLVTSRPWLEYRPDGLTVNSRLKWLCLALSVAIFLQLIVGAQYRHLGTGFAYHVLGAIVIMLLLSCVVMWVTGEYQDRVLLFKPVKHLGLLLMLQLMLGVGSFVVTMDSDAGRPASFWEWVVPSVHVATGALILAVSVVLAIGGFRVFGSRTHADTTRAK